MVSVIKHVLLHLDLCMAQLYCCICYLSGEILSDICMDIVTIIQVLVRNIICEDNVLVIVFSLIL